MRKLRVALLYGGKSVEHEVSLRSARNVAAALDRRKYAVARVFIPKSGRFDPSALRRFDVVFPVLHGTNGEDGTMQGLLSLLDVAYVGPGVLGSAVGMDKDVAKRLMREAGIPTARSLTVRRGERLAYAAARMALGRTLFVKPANAGSSVGVSKANDRASYDRAVREAFRYDAKILIEEAVDGREIEVSVLGNERPEASVPGEIVPRHEFYSYEAKYRDENGAELRIPAPLPARKAAEAQALAVRTFKVLGLEGMARVDFFLRRRDGKFLINEVNTLPGFTEISMYPKLWEASGLPTPKLVDRLIRLALDRRRRDRALRLSYVA